MSCNGAGPSSASEFVPSLLTCLALPCLALSSRTMGEPFCTATLLDVDSSSEPEQEQEQEQKAPSAPLAPTPSASAPPAPTPSAPPAPTLSAQPVPPVPTSSEWGFDRDFPNQPVVDITCLATRCKKARLRSRPTGLMYAFCQCHQQVLLNSRNLLTLPWAGAAVEALLRARKLTRISDTPLGLGSPTDRLTHWPNACTAIRLVTCSGSWA